MKDSPVPSTAHTRSVPWSVFSNVNFSIPTEVATSGVPGGGLARFARGAAAAGARVYAAPLLAAADFVAATPAGCVPAEEVPVLVLAEGADLDALAAHFASAPGEGGADLAHIQEKLSWFVGSVRGGKNAVEPGSSASDHGDIMASHSLHFNHSENCNVRLAVEDGVFVIRVVRDITAGDELFVDYNSFDISPGTCHWFKQHGLRDTKSMAKDWQKVGQEVGA